LVFYAKKVGGYDLESFPYENLSSFEMSKGMMGHKMSFFASGNKVTMKWIKQGDIPRFTETVRARMGKVATRGGDDQPPASPDTSQAGVAEQLRQLASLRDDGILTDDEFQAKKAELLAKL
jgi:hypothetical protein